jgi:transposase
MKERVKHYTDEFKFEVVQEYLNRDCSQKDLLEKYEIGGGSTISEWMRRFGLKSPSIRQSPIRANMSRQADKSSKEKELEAKVQELQKQLEYEQLRVLALNTLIEVAERDLKISIRKKPGAKQ